MVSSLLKLIFTTIVMVIALNAATPPIWGGSLMYSVNVSFIYDDPIMKWNFTYYYNWKLKS